MVNMVATATGLRAKDAARNAPRSGAEADTPTKEVQFGELSWPGAERRRARGWEFLVNKVLHKLHLPITLRRHFDHRRDMVSLEQANNLQVLLTAVLDHGVPGAVVELGCHTGATACVFARVLQGRGAAHPFHVYDLFEGRWSPEQSVRDRFEANLRERGLPLPQVHAGDVLRTVPAELPERIAFAHIDLGTGGDRALHRTLVLHALTHVYPRLSPHGVIVFMDHHRPGLTVDGFNSNPGVTEACDRFFADKAETVRMLYGGPCSHAYIRKG